MPGYYNGYHAGGLRIASAGADPARNRAAATSILEALKGETDAGMRQSLKQGLATVATQLTSADAVPLFFEALNQASDRLTSVESTNALRTIASRLGPGENAQAVAGTARCDCEGKGHLWLSETCRMSSLGVGPNGCD